MHLPIVIPQPIETALQEGATLAISISGGKDSQAMLCALAEAHAKANWSGYVVAIHAHLGRMEWPQTLAHCEAICVAVDIPLVVVNRPQGDLLQEMQDRMEKLRGTGKPHFPSSVNRYCTSDQKRAQIDKVLRSPWPSSTQRYCTADQKRDQIVKVHRQHNLVVAAMGMRAEESPARSRKPSLSIGERVTAKALHGLTPDEALGQKREKQRLAFDWLPLHNWTVDNVWAQLDTSRTDLERRQELYRQGQHEAAFDGWKAHPAYVMGNQRLSCAICVLASKSDITNGARHNPELYRELVAMEEESGFSFRQDLRLGELQL